ncbi:MAG: UTP--glucose-1-phosphate uridylyltransferase [Clostridiales bacterium]|nr:UTP--glucose-1-phosphate uridylyltransferase [Clostridiales bacterium]
MKIKKAVILCGGFGTRFLPITKVFPKEMLPIIDRPVLDYIIDEVKDSGIGQIMLVISPSKTVIPQYYSPDPQLTKKLTERKQTAALGILAKIGGAEISYAVQEDAEGSGHALSLAESFCGGEPFALLNGDDVVYSETPAVGQLSRAYERCGLSVIGMQRRPEPEIRRYGVADLAGAGVDGLYKLKGIIEKPSAPELSSDLCSLGRYVFTPDIFDAIRRTPYCGFELRLTDAISALIASSGAYAYEFTGRRYDMGDKYETIEAAIEFALRNPEYADRLKAYLNKLTKELGANP